MGKGRKVWRGKLVRYDFTGVNFVSGIVNDEIFVDEMFGDGKAVNARVVSRQKLYQFARFWIADLQIGFVSISVCGCSSLLSGFTRKNLADIDVENIVCVISHREGIRASYQPWLALIHDFSSWTVAHSRTSISSSLNTTHTTTTMADDWEEDNDDWTEDENLKQEHQEKGAHQLGFLPFARLRELEANLHDVCGVTTCQSCELDGSSELLQRDTAAILRCGHIFCRQCISSDRETPRNARFCPKCSEKFRSMYVLNEQGKLVRWSIGGDRGKKPGRKRRREEESSDAKKEKKGKDCVIQ